MSTWTDEALRAFGAAHEVEIQPVRRNGELRRATPIWIVRSGDDLYVRAAYGARTGWYVVARTSRQAHLRAGGTEQDVTIEDADGAVLDRVDAAYREKYGNGSIVDGITDDEHRVLTLRLRPAAAATG